MEAVPWTTRSDGLWLNVRLTPKARRPGLGGLLTEADGTKHLKAAVSAPPEDGKANAALVELVAKSLRLAKRDVTLVKGDKDRRKVLELIGDPTALAAALGPYLERDSS